MYAIIAILLAVFSAPAFSATSCIWVFIGGVETCTHPPPQQRTISGTYTMPQLQAGVTAVNMFIAVAGFNKSTGTYDAPLTYTVPVTGSYSLQVPAAVEYQIEGHYDVNDGRLSPDSPIITAW